VPNEAETFVLTEITFEAENELFVSYASVHDVAILAWVVKLVPVVNALLPLVQFVRTCQL